MRGVLIGVCMAIWLCGPAQACEHEPMLREVELAHRLPAGILVALAEAESSCRADAVGDGDETRGLLQVSRQTWYAQTDYSFDRAFEPTLNAEVAAGWLARRRSGDVRQLAAWYNAGARDWRALNHRWSMNHPNRIYRRLYRTGELP